MYLQLALYWSIAMLIITKRILRLAISIILTAVLYAQYVPPGGGGGSATTPGGSNTQVQFNDSTAFGGNSDFTFNKITGLVAIGPTILPLPNEITITAAPYYGSGSATTTTTSGTFGVGTSGSVASCSTFSANQGVYIAGAGAAGVSYVGTVVSCSGTTLTITPTTATSVANGTLVQHDDTAAVQAAIAALTTTGGKVVFPDGMYHINGPRQDTGGANARIVLPCNSILPSFALAAEPTFELTGNAPPAYEFADPVMSTGAILQTDDAGDAVTGGAIIGGYCVTSAFANRTGVRLEMKNLTVRQPDNPSQISIDAHQMVFARFQDVNIDTKVSVYSQAQPTHVFGIGLWLPGEFNYTLVHVKNVQVMGYRYGIIASEHAVLDNISLYHNTYALDIYGSTHAIYGSRILIQHCTNGIVAEGAATVYFSELDFERRTNAIFGSGQSYFNTTYEINDNANYLSGQMNWHSITAGGANNTSLLLLGGTSLYLSRIDTMGTTRATTISGYYLGDGQNLWAGGPPFTTPVTLPDASGFSWLNQSTSTETAVGSGALKLTIPGDTGTIVRARLTSIGANTQLRTVVMPQVSANSNSICGVLLYESGTGKVEMYGNYYGQLTVIYYSNSTTFSSFLLTGNTPGAKIIQPRTTPSWYGVGYNGTNVSAISSPDHGLTWTTDFSESKTAHFTTAPDQWGYGCSAFENISIGELLLSYVVQ